jgi:hypothetical protein
MRISVSHKLELNDFYRSFVGCRSVYARVLVPLKTSEDVSLCVRMSTSAQYEPVLYHTGTGGVLIVSNPRYTDHFGSNEYKNLGVKC